MKTLSYSQMSMFWDCPQKWYKYYVEEIERPTIPAFIFGKMVHNYIEEELNGKHIYITPQDLPYSKDFDDDVNKIVTLGTKAIESLSNYAELGFMGQPVIEQWFELPVENGIFNGKIDLSFINKYNEHILIDWKTTSKAFTEHDIKTSNQLTCYAYAYWRIYDVVPNKVCYITLNKKTYETKLYCGTRTMGDILAVEKQIVDTIYAMERMTNHKNENACNGKYGKCPFYSKCWGGEVGIIDEVVELWQPT